MASPRTTLEPIDADAVVPYEYTTNFALDDLAIFDIFFSQRSSPYILDLEANARRPSSSRSPLTRGPEPIGSPPSQQQQQQQQQPGRTAATDPDAGSLDYSRSRRGSGRGDDGGGISSSTSTIADQTQHLPHPGDLLPPPSQSSPLQPQTPRERPGQFTPRGPELNSDDFLQLLAAEDFSSPSILGRGSSIERTRTGSRPKIETPTAVRRQPSAPSAASAWRTSPSDSMPQTRTRSWAAAAASRLRGGARAGDSSSSASSAASSSSAIALPGSYPDDTIRSSSASEVSPSRTRRVVKRRRNGEPVTAESASTSASSSASAAPTAPTSLSSSFTSTATSTGANNSNNHTPQSAKKRPRQGATIILDDDDLFGSDSEGIEVVNLTSADRPDADKREEEDQEEEKPVIEPTPAPSKKIKLAAYQCAICMDDVTDLMVTHCGHLFCCKCIHSSLHMDATRKACPICRQKIEPRRPGQSKTARSYFPLELKLMTRNRQGKQPARQP